MRRFTLIAAGFVAGVVLASGIVAAVAATSGTSAKACVDSKGQLRLLGKHGCSKGTRGLTLSAAGPRGAAGAPGTAGAPGPAGPTGATGTPDTSNFYTKSQSDGRYAPLGAAGNELDVPGVAFVPLGASTMLDTSDFVGVYETAGLGGLVANLEALPRDATITSVDFYLLDNTAGTVTVQVVEGDPTSMTTPTYAGTASLTTTSASEQTVTVTPVFGPYTPPVGDTPLLYWVPPAASASEVLYGAAVHYTIG